MVTVVEVMVVIVGISEVNCVVARLVTCRRDYPSPSSYKILLSVSTHSHQTQNGILAFVYQGILLLVGRKGSKGRFQLT